MSTGDRLAQIEKISQNARTTWFALLALLVFVGVTLMGHKDADFFAYGAATTLPIVGIDVPPTAFFLAAPILTAALYCYLHIYLLGLWDALGDIEQEPGAPPLADRIVPTVFTITALWYRSFARRDGAMAPRVLGTWTVLLAYLLVWGFGIIVLGWTWWRTMPAHEPLITLVSGLCLWAAAFVEARSRNATGLPHAGPLPHRDLRARWATAGASTPSSLSPSCSCRGSARKAASPSGPLMAPSSLSRWPAPTCARPNSPANPRTGCHTKNG